MAPPVWLKHVHIWVLASVHPCLILRMPQCSRGVSTCSLLHYITTNTKWQQQPHRNKHFSHKTTWATLTVTVTRPEEVSAGWFVRPASLNSSCKLVRLNWPWAVPDDFCGQSHTPGISTEDCMKSGDVIQAWRVTWVETHHCISLSVQLPATWRLCVCYLASAAEDKDEDKG